MSRLVRERFRGGLGRILSWAVLASLSCLVVALGVGVGGFEFLGRQVEAPLRIVRSTHVSERTAELIRGSGRQAPTSMTADAASEQEIEIVKRQSEAPAPIEALAGAPPASVTQSNASSVLPAPQSAESAVQSTALELRTGTPQLNPGEQTRATVTYYYCRAGTVHRGPAALGDGGNFCGIMRDGSIVYPGAAACDDAYLGQLFRIIGDPTGRVYKCADTGSAVHGLHRDIWFMVSDEGWVWLQSIGDVATIEILP